MQGAGRWRLIEQALVFAWNVLSLTVAFELENFVGVLR